MQTLFENVLTASLYGSVIIAALVLARPLLKKLPEKYLCLLWLLAFLRLLMPFEIPFVLSLQPDVTAITQPQAVVQPAIQVLPEPVPAVPENAPMPEDVEVVYSDAFTPPESIPEGLEGYYPPAEEVSQPLVIDWNRIGFYVWAAVACGLAGYSLLSYGKLKRRVREAVRCRDGVWECAGLETAFILGWVRPRVYLPMGLSADTRHHILRHERAHLKRRDHWLKLLGFLALAVHWFNPLVWVAWVLLCRDMELACDEQVVKDMGLSERKDYSAALLQCSTRKEHYLACPVAFGEVSVKARILSVLNYRRPRFWISLIGIVAILFVAVFFMTSPAEPPEELAWAVRLRERNVASVELYSEFWFAQPDKAYQLYEGEELKQVIRYINDIDAQVSSDQKDWEPSATLVVTLKNGTVHRIEKCGSAFLTVDNVFCVSHSDWLENFPSKGNAPMPGNPQIAVTETVSAEEQALIDRCQSAMEAVMYADCYHIGVSVEYTSSPFLTDYWEAEYWKHYGDRLSSNYPDSDFVTAWVMERDGNRFRRADCASWVSPDLQSHNWLEAEFDEIEESRLLPWFHYVDWNRDSISVMQHTVSGDTEEIVLKHSQVDGYGDQSGWIMTFLLDKEGRLLSIGRNLTEFNGLACAGTFTTTFYSFDPDEVYDDFLINAHPPGEDHREELLRCYSALCWHQMQDYRHSRMHVFYTGRLAEEEELNAEYWHTPATSLRKLSMEGRNDGWLAEKKDTVYCMGIKPYYPPEVTDYTTWVEVADPEENVMTTWLEEYRWDFSQIEFLSSQQQGDRTVIRFRVNEVITDNLGGSADNHVVTFCINKDNALLWAADNYAIQGTPDADTYGYTVSAEIQILTYDGSTVTEDLEETLAEIRFPY